MNSRLETQKAVTGLSCDQMVKSDDGLVVNLSCSVSCQGETPKDIVVSSDFIPEDLGLTPGNGSNGDKLTIWGSLGTALKVWSQDQCLVEGKKICGDLKAAVVKVTSLESGDWKLARFPGCQEKSITLSPFGDGINSKRIEKKTPLMKGLGNFGTPPKKGALSTLVKYLSAGVLTKCQRKISAKICFGDCIDLTSKDIVETLGTSEPLGTDEVEMCADELYEHFSRQQLSKAVKQNFCEMFFWNNYKEMPMSCAAVRGDVRCDSLID